ncbi:MAG: glycosyltransferase family 2 protein [Patescibacteria group bacterium]
MENNNLVKIAAVVVTYNRKELLKECLDSLLKQDHKLDAIIIIDNASNDGTGEMLEKKYLNNSVFDYINLKENLGGAGGFHYGIKRACEKGFDWIWCMDDDVVPQSNALQNMLNVSLDKKIGYLCSRVVGINGESINTPVIDFRKNINMYPSWEENLNKSLVKVRFSTFVSVLLNRNIVNKVGLPFKEFFIWGDDTEYTSRITNICPGYIVGNSIVVHKRKIQEPPEIFREKDPVRIKNFFYKTRNVLFYKKKYSKQYFLPFSIIWELCILLRCLVSFPYPLLKAKIVLKGLLFFFFFHPKIEFPKEK